MVTQLLQIMDIEKDRENLMTAADTLRAGGTVIIPTETVYGLAADALQPQAVAKIFEAKGRPADNPLIVHIARIEELETLVTAVPDAARLLAEHFWPGPLTMILPKAEKVPLITTGGLDSVAVRMPESAIARAIIEAAGVPLAAPSANRSGSPSPTTSRHCQDDMWGRVDAIVESENCRVGVESTVISLCGSVPTLLRPGAVTLEQLQAVLGEVSLDPGVTQKLAENAKALSPGMKYTHYSPEAQVLLLRGSPEQFGGYVSFHQQEGDFAMCFEEDIPYLDAPLVSYGGMEDHERQAHELFDILRELDKLEAERIFVHAPAPEGIGLAVYNRLLRAAGFQLLELNEIDREAPEE